MTGPLFASCRLHLEVLEDRLVPSTMAGTYNDGTWRYDTTAGWAHISTLKADILDVDDGGDVYAEYIPGNANNGLWRWSASTMTWQKLSDLLANRIQVTADGILYGTFGSNGTWRWSPTTGWDKLSGFISNVFAVSDSDAFFGSYAAGSVGIWRWTTGSGWQLLTSSQSTFVKTDASGDMVALFGTSGQQGLWRWNPNSGWARLDTVFANSFGVSGNGAIYESRGPGGLWYAAPGDSSFTEIDSAAQTSANVFALPDGSLYVSRSDGTQINSWRWSPREQGLGFVKIISNSLNIFPVIVGKDGDLFFKDGTTPGTGYWSLNSVYHTISNKTPSFLASQR
jgi:hypothetical protein